MNFEDEKDFERFFQAASLKSDKESLTEALKRFIWPHMSVITCNYRGLPQRTTSFFFPKISEDFLSSVHLHLWTCSEHLQQQPYDPSLGQLCASILQCMIVLSRSSANVKAVSSDEFVQLLFSIFEALHRKQPECTHAKDFMDLFFFFLECLYDPCFFWRQTLDRSSEPEQSVGDVGSAQTTPKKSAEASKHQPLLLLPTSLHVQFIPFFYDFLNDDLLKAQHRIHLISLFLASIHGSPTNAIKVICPASIDALIKLLMRVATSSSLSSPATLLTTAPPPLSSSSSSSPPSSSSSSSSCDDELFSLLTASLSVLVWKVCSFPVDKRQVEASMILEAVWLVVDKMCVHKDYHNSTIVISALLQQLCTTVEHNTGQLQILFVHCNSLQHSFKLLQSITNFPASEVDKLVQRILSFLFTLLKHSIFAKDTFQHSIGYDNFYNALKALRPLSKRVFEQLYDLAVEQEVLKHDSLISFNSKAYSICNVHMVSVMTRLLEEGMQAEALSSASSLLLHLTTSSRHNRVTCSQHDIVHAVLEQFSRSASSMDIKILSDLLDLFESVASVNISFSSVRKLLSLLHSCTQLSSWFVRRLLRVACKVAESREAGACQLTYFLFKQPHSGIRIEKVGTVGGSGLTLLAWVAFNKASSYLNHFDIITVTACGSSSMVLRLAAEGVLKVLMTHRKVTQEFTVPESPMLDEEWHLVTLVHSSGKRLFGQSQVSVYVDAVPHLCTTTSLPVLSEISSVLIGTCSKTSSKNQAPPVNPPTQTTSSSSSSISSSSSSSSSISSLSPPLWKRLVKSNIFRSSSADDDDNKGRGKGEEGDSGKVLKDEAVVMADNNKNDNADGGDDDDGSRDYNNNNNMQAPVCLEGSVVEVLLFAEALSSSQVECLYRAGIDLSCRMNVDNEQLCSLYNRPLLWLNAKASDGGVCRDLSKSGRQASLSGVVCQISHMKNVMHSIGGMKVILSLFDQLYTYTSASSSSSEEGAFFEELLELLGVLLQGQVSQQESFVRCSGFPIVGCIFNKMNPRLINKSLLASLKKLLKTLTTTCNNNNNTMTPAGSIISDSNVENLPLMQQLYEFVLLDFRIWSKAQDLSVILEILDMLYDSASRNRSFFRKKFGVQFLLDSVHLYFRETSERQAERLTDSLSSIRASCCRCMQLYVGREVYFTELNQLLSSLTVCQQAFASDIVSLLASLLERSGRNDQIFLLMFEASRVELLYALLVSPRHSLQFKEALVKVIEVLLESTRVSELNKLPMRLLETDFYHGFVHHMVLSRDFSDVILNYLLHQSLANDTSLHFSNILSTVHLCASLADINSKCAFLLKILLALLSKPQLARTLCCLPAWVNSFVELLVDSGRSTGGDETKWSDSAFKMTGSMDSDGSSLNDSMSSSYSNCISNNFNSQSAYYTRSSFEDPYTSTTNNPFFSSPSSNLVDEANNTITIESPPPSASINSPFAGKYIFSPSPKNLSPSVQDFNHVLKSLSLSSFLPPGKLLSKEHELVAEVLVLLYVVAWRCNDDAVVDEEAWKVRNYVFCSLYNLKTSNKTLFLSPTEVLRRFFELLLLATYNDMNQLPISSRGNVAKSAVRLMHFLFFFLHNNPSAINFSEQLLHQCMELMSAVILLLPADNEERSRMGELQLAILLLFIGQTDADSSTQAVIHLHELVHSNNIIEDPSKTCYTIALLNQAFTKADSVEWRETSTPLMGTLLEKSRHLLQLPLHLPQLPEPSSFFNNFRSFQMTQQWNEFILKHVDPSYRKYWGRYLKGIVSEVKNVVESNHDELLVAVHRLSRRRQESIIKFEKQYLKCMKAKETEEIGRQKALKSRLKAEVEATERSWQALKQRGSMEGLLQDHLKPPQGPLGMSECENERRMRPKLLHGEVKANLYNLKKAPLIHAAHQNVVSELKSLEVDRLKAVSSEEEEEKEEEEEEEEKDFSNNKDVTSPSAVEQRGAVMSVECELVTLREKLKGRLEITSQALIFTNTSSRTGCSVRLPLEQVREVFLRRHNLRSSALEIFLVNHSNFFFNFHKAVRNRVYTRITRLKPSNLINHTSRSPAELAKASGLTQKWLNRQLSNFDYLMHLNTLSGRTYNDLSQYPVFPWILSDYTSEKLDLDDPAVYRDLRWPVGATNPKNRALLKEKYESVLESSGEASDLFHHGTHYSNPAGVMHYLLRLEPFTSLHVQLQDGSFDLSDRQFHDIASTWQALSNNPNDVKELIPEFFYLPEFLVNHNDLDLGEMQGRQGRFGDVVLPRWAHSPHDFIHKHMQALESEHVSTHLHHWIDLIFGFKQRGAAAVEALNVFYYCSYEGAVDLDAETDVKRRHVLEGIITNFGQTPSQLFKEPHPRRQSRSEWLEGLSRVDRPVSVLDCLERLKETSCLHVSPLQHPPIFISSLPSPSLLSSSILPTWNLDTLVVITSTGLLALHEWLPHDKGATAAAHFNQDTSIFNPRLQKRLYNSSSEQSGSASLHCTSPDGRLVVSAGHWDNSLRVLNVPKIKQVAHLVSHTDIVTCVKMDGLGRRVVSGSRDFTCIVWEVLYKGLKSDNLNASPLQVLQGHRSEVTSVDLSWSLDLVVSASKEGVVLVHSMEDGACCRTFRPGHSASMATWQVVLSEMGYVACCHSYPSGGVGCNDAGGSGAVGNASSGAGSGGNAAAASGAHTDSKESPPILHLYSINGLHLSRDLLSEHVTHMITCGAFLVVAYESGLLQVKKMHNLETVMERRMGGRINCIATTSSCDHLLVALHNSTVTTLTLDRSIKALQGK